MHFFTLHQIGDIPNISDLGRLFGYPAKRRKKYAAIPVGDLILAQITHISIIQNVCFSAISLSFARAKLFHL